MFSSLLLAAAPALASVAIVSDQAAEQSVQMSRNGEFLAKNYPPRALKAGEEGKVGFRIVVEPDGSLGTCEVTLSSGFPSLDNETCEIIVRNARLQPVKNSEGRPVRAVQNGFINWKLPAGVESRATATQTAAKGKSPKRLICKKSQTTGSLISRTKQCMTAEQWAEAQRINRDEAERIIGTGHFEDESPQ